MFFMRQAAVAAILAATAWCFPTLWAAEQPWKRTWNYLAARDWRDLQLFAVERAGEEVLPAKVRGALELMRRNAVPDFFVSKAILRDPDESVPQRLAEGAYPIRVNEKSRHLIVSSDEPVPATCAKLGAVEGVTLVRSSKPSS